MIINTKFENNEEVFVLHGAKIYNEKIMYFSIDSTNNINTIKYMINIINRSIYFNEDKVFKTKEELIKSL